MEMRGFDTNQVQDEHNNVPQNNSNHTNPIPSQPPPPILPQTGVRYGECLKNHAANVGGHVTDGCGEFMPSGEEGLKCAACDCHRSFHRRETEGGTETPSGSATPQYYPYNLNRSNNNLAHRATHGHVVQRPPPPPPPFSASQQRYGRAGGPPVMMTFGGGGVAESSSEELDLIRMNQGTGHESASKKRFRTKFTPEQKGKMREFGERIGWKIQKQNENDVQQFCTEVGIKRQVFKVWMHNCNQASKKKQS